MIKYYLKIAGRNIVRSKGFSIINVLGLAIGIACAFIVYLYADFELGYDKSIKDHNRIFRVITDDYLIGSEPRHIAGSPLGLIPVLKNFPQIESMCYFVKMRGEGLKYKNESIGDNGIIIKADPDFFNVFSSEFLFGNANSINLPNTCVITKGMVDRYFMDKNPIGEILVYENISYKITGVIENYSNNTHVNFDFIFSFNPSPFDITDWREYAYTYIKFKPETNIGDFNNAIKNIYKKEMGESYNPRRNKTFFVQSLSDIHFNSNFSYDIAIYGNINQLYLYSFVGILILLIACINYTNLTTARYINRAKEIGVRKTVGAGKSNLIIQFLFESLIFTFIAHIIAIFIVEISLPYLNILMNMNLQIDYSSLRTGIGIISLIIITTLISGSYPAFLLSSFKPDRILKGVLHTNSGIIRRVLVVFQFVISIVLFITVIVINSQILFMKNYELGFDKEHKLVIYFSNEVVDINSYRSVKSQFMQIPNVNICSFLAEIPGKIHSDFSLWLPGEGNIRAFQGNKYYVDEDYCALFNLRFVAGNNFSPESSFDNLYNHYIIMKKPLKHLDGSHLKKQSTKNFLQIKVKL